jgi:hypothetical protein
MSLINVIGHGIQSGIRRRCDLLTAVLLSCYETAVLLSAPTRLAVQDCRLLQGMES